MIFDPLLPPILMVLVALLLLAFVGVGAVQARGKARLHWVGRGVMVLALIAALARPGVGTMSTEVADEFVDVVFVVDTSASVAAEDWDGNQPRLVGMQEDISALAQQYPGARYALLSFDSVAVQRLPFTTDTSALENTLTTLLPEDLRHAQGTSVGVAADLLFEVLDRASLDYPDRSRVVYYLGDGEQTAESSVESFADSAELIQGGAVFGYGTVGGAQMREYDAFGPTSDYVRDRSFDTAISTLDDENLTQIAADLRLPLEIRSADDSVVAAEVDASRGQALEGSSQQFTAFPLYWIFGVVIVVWLLVEAWLLGRTANELRTAREQLE